MNDRTSQLRDILQGIHMLNRSVGMRSKFTHGSSLTHSQWLVIGIIARENEVSVKDIHTSLHVSSSAATQIINSLLAGGYVRKHQDPKDARISIVSLTVKTKKMLSSIQENGLAHMSEIFSTLNDAEFETFMKLHAKLVAGCQNKK